MASRGGAYPRTYIHTYLHGEEQRCGVCWTDGWVGGWGDREAAARRRFVRYSCPSTAAKRERARLVRGRYLGTVLCLRALVRAYIPTLSTLLFSALLCSALLYSALLYSALLYSSLLCSPLLSSPLISSCRTHRSVHKVQEVR